MQFCLDMHVWKDESHANHVSGGAVLPCKQLCAANSLKSKHCISLLALLSVWGGQFPAEGAVHQVEFGAFLNLVDVAWQILLICSNGLVPRASPVIPVQV